MGQGMRNRFFESPHAATYILILLNSAIFGVTLIGSSPVRIDPAALLQYGALHKAVLIKHEYWRLIAYAFLHANVLHLGVNMLCIAAWSGILEHRLGATYFLLVYLASAIGGGIASIYGHPGAFLGVGASGAISGIVGALLCLTILGKLPLTPQFFAVTIGANAILATRAPHIDWYAHLGGFTAGFACCALLDSVEALNGYWLRCKFPEFAKFGIATGIFAAGLLYFQAQVLDSGDAWAIFGAGCFACLLAIKLADLMLAWRKGLAVFALLVATLYGALAFAAGSALSAAFPPSCAPLLSSAYGANISGLASLTNEACERAYALPAFLGLFIFAATLIFLRSELRRGVNDAGFVAAGFRAERNRRHGL